MAVDQLKVLTDLNELLANLGAELSEKNYVFASFPSTRFDEIAALRPLSLFREAEGVTAILTEAEAASLSVMGEAVFRRISLSVHSSLEAVGLTSAISKELTIKGISANVVAGYYHDHIFVPKDKAKKALSAIEGLTSRAACTIAQWPCKNCGDNV